MASAVRVWVPLNTRCSMRWDMPARPSGSCREPVSTHTPTATDRTCSIRSVTTRMPLGGTLFRYPSLTGTAFSGARRIRRLWVLEVFLVRQRRLVAQRHLPAEPHLAVAVDLDDLDEHLIALGQHVLDGADAGLGDLRNVQEPLGVGDDLHERAELDDLLDLPEVDPIQLDLAADVLDDPQGLLHRRVVGREHGDPTVVLDVDLRARLLLDATDDLAAGADDLADLFGPDLDRDEPRRVGRKLGPWLLDGLAHLRQHDESRIPRLLQRGAHDVDRHAGDLDVHLKRGHALLGAGDLEVHVAVVVLGAVDVGQDPDLVSFLDQPQGDTRDVGPQGPPGVNQSQRGTTPRGHRRRPVRLENVRHDPDRVRELFLRGQHRFDRPLRQGAVTDVPPRGPAVSPDLADRERREVVVQHEVPVVLALEGLDLLLVRLRAQRGRDERLGLSPGEDTRAVGPRQVGHVDRAGRDLVHLAAIDADAALDDEPPHLGLLDRLEHFAHRPLLRLVHPERLDHLLEHPVDGLGPRLLFMAGECRGQLGCGQALDPGGQLGIASRRRVEGPARLGRALRQIPLRPREPLALGMTEGDRLEHGFFGHLVGSRLHHQHGVFGAGDDELQARRLLLRRGRVRDRLAVDQADPHGADGSVERNARQAEGRRSAVHRQHVGVVFLVAGDHETDDLYLVPEAVGEQRPDRPVDQTRRQRLFLDRSALSLEIAAGDSPARVRALAVFDGQREEVLRFLRALGGDARRQDHGTAVANDHGPVGLLGHLARFDGHAEAVDLDLYRVGHANVCPRVSAGIRRTPWGADAKPARPGAPGFVPSEDRSIESDSAVNGGCPACR